MGPRHVALPARANGERGARAPRRAENHPVADDRRGNHLVSAAAASPELAAGVGIVGLHSLLSVDDHLVVIADVDGDRRAPSDRRLSRRSPDWRARARIECGDERARRLILIDDDAILVEQRRACGAVVVVDASEIPLPEDLSLEIEGEQPPAAEGHVDAFAVGGWRGRGVPVLEVRRIAPSLRRECLPQFRAVGPAKRKQRQSSAAILGGRQQNPVAPDNR